MARRLARRPAAGEWLLPSLMVYLKTCGHFFIFIFYPKSTYLNIKIYLELKLPEDASPASVLQGPLAF